jgi:hypothetical protein
MMLKLAKGGIAAALLALAGCSSGSDTPSLAQRGTPMGEAYMADAGGAVFTGSSHAPAAPMIGMMGDGPRQSLPLSQAIQLAERPTGEIYVHDIPGRRLTGAEIRQVAAGNTMVGPRLSVHYRPDGDAEMVIFSQRYTGEWRVSSSDMMCHSFPSFAPWSGTEVCYEWYLDGNRLSTYEPITGAGATRGENVLLAGNRIN